MDKVTITPPAGAMAHFKRALHAAQCVEAEGASIGLHGYHPIHSFKFLNVKVVAKPGRPHRRRVRDVLDDVVEALGEPSKLPGCAATHRTAVDLFGPDGRKVLWELQPLRRAHYEIAGIDVVDDRDAPSYDKALLVVRGENPNAFSVSAALGDASPDGPFGNIWKLYDARIAKRTGDWSGASDRYFMLSTPSVKDTIFGRVVLDEIDPEPWNPVAEAGAEPEPTKAEAERRKAVAEALLVEIKAEDARGARQELQDKVKALRALVARLAPASELVRCDTPTVGGYEYALLRDGALAMPGTMTPVSIQIGSARVDALAAKADIAALTAAMLTRYGV